MNSFAALQIDSDVEEAPRASKKGTEKKGVVGKLLGAYSIELLLIAEDINAQLLWLLSRLLPR